MKKHSMLCVIILCVICKGCCCVTFPFPQKQLYIEETPPVDHIARLSPAPLEGKTEGDESDRQTIDKGSEDFLE